MAHYFSGMGNTILLYLGIWDFIMINGIFKGNTLNLLYLLSVNDGTTDWFQIGKGVLQGYILSPCLFNSYAEYIMQNDRLDEAQAGIKIAGRNINNLR